MTMGCNLVLLFAAMAGAQEHPRQQIVMSTDRGQFEGLAAALASLVTFTETASVGVTLVTPREDAKRAEKLAQCVGVSKVRVVPFEDTNVTRLKMVNASELSSKNLKKWTGYRQELGSVLNFVRFYLPEIVPGDGPTLYVDSDVVIRCDVKSFLDRCRQMFLHDQRATILVAPRSDDVKKKHNVEEEDEEDEDISSKKKQRKHRRRRRKKHRRLGHVLESSEQLFNAGVFVADLHRWRARNATGRLEQIFHDVAKAAVVNFSAAAWHRPSSQAPMTRVFQTEYAYLDSSGWNHRMKMKSRHPGGDKSNVCLWHFVGASKPWHVLEKHILHPQKDSDSLKQDIALRPLLSNDTKLHDLPWWVTTWLPHARFCCVDRKSSLCKWHNSLPQSDLDVLNMPRPRWPKDS